LAETRAKNWKKAREYGISRQAISKKFSLQSNAVKDVANQIVESETKIRESLQKLTPSLQFEACNLARKSQSKHRSAAEAPETHQKKPGFYCGE
jgi:hypothetical protein